jgi:LPS-assembly lipoprotein
LLSNRFSRRVALLGLLGLAGCGFAPMYGDGAATQGIFAFESDESVLGFRLRARLANRLGQTANPQFAVKATLTVSERAATITEGNDTSRLNVIGSANWSLIDLATNQQIKTGKVEGFTSYSASASTVATQTAKDDAGARLAVILADLIATRVLVATSDQPS